MKVSPGGASKHVVHIHTSKLARAMYMEMMKFSLYVELVKKRHSKICWALLLVHVVVCQTKTACSSLASIGSLVISTHCFSLAILFAPLSCLQFYFSFLLSPITTWLLSFLHPCLHFSLLLASFLCSSVSASRRVFLHCSLMAFCWGDSRLDLSAFLHFFHHHSFHFFGYFWATEVICVLLTIGSMPLIITGGM